MPHFTAFDPATRIILYSGTTGLVSSLPHPAFEGVAADPATYRVKADFSGVEPKPALGATVDPLAIEPGGSVTVTVPEPCAVYVDGVFLGEIAASDTIDFADVGAYRLRLEPSSQLLLAEEFTVTVAEP